MIINYQGVEIDRGDTWGNALKTHQRHHHDVYHHVSSRAVAPAVFVNSWHFVFKAAMRESTSVENWGTTAAEIIRLLPCEKGYWLLPDMTSLSHLSCFTPLLSPPWTQCAFVVLELESWSESRENPLCTVVLIVKLAPVCLEGCVWSRPGYVLWEAPLSTIIPRWAPPSCAWKTPPHSSPKILCWQF